jgi:hypothetical protein
LVDYRRVIIYGGDITVSMMEYAWEGKRHGEKVVHMGKNWCGEKLIDTVKNCYYLIA